MSERSDTSSEEQFFHFPIYSPYITPSFWCGNRTLQAPVLQMLRFPPSFASIHPRNHEIVQDRFTP